MSLAAVQLGSFSNVSAASAYVIFTRLRTLNGVYLNGQLPPGFVQRLTIDRNLCKEMVRICRMASETAILLGSPFDAAVLSRYETNLQSLSIQQPRPQRRLPATRAQPDPESHEPATAALLHGDLESSAGSASAALQDSSSHLPADSANDALLYDDHPWAADSVSAALGHGDYDSVAGPASTALLYDEPECSNDAAGVDFFVFDSGQSPPDSWDDIVHQDVIPADILDAWLLTS